MTSCKFSYPMIENWVFAAGLLQATLGGVRVGGQFRKESGAFWLGIREPAARVSAVVFPRGPGVKEAPGFWRVSPEVFGAVARWAVPLGLCLLGVVHTHVGNTAPFLSWTDRRFGVRVPGVLAIVLLKGGKDGNHLNWGWYLFDHDEYRELSGSELRRRLIIDSTMDFATLCADEYDVRPERVK